VNIDLLSFDYKAVYFLAFVLNLEQVAATCGTRAKLGTPSNFQWHAETPSFTYQFCYNSQEILLIFTCTKIRM